MVRYSPRTDGFIQQLILGRNRSKQVAAFDVAGIYGDPQKGKAKLPVGMSLLTPVMMQLPGYHWATTSAMRRMNVHH